MTKPTSGKTQQTRPARSRRSFWVRLVLYAAAVATLVGVFAYRWAAIHRAERDIRGDAIVIGPGPKPSGWDEPVVDAVPAAPSGSPSQWVRQRQPPAAAPTHVGGGAVAVLPFASPENQAALAAVAGAAGDVIATRLAQDPHCNVVDRQRLDALLSEHAMTLAGMVDQQTAVQVGKLVGATTVVTGQLMPGQADTWVALANAYAVADGRLLASGRRETKADRLVETLVSLADQLAGPMQIELEPLPPAMLDHHPAASLHRMRAMADLVSGQYLRAVMSLMKVERLDPQASDTAYWMGVAYQRAGMVEQAAIELRRYLARDGQGPYAARAQETLAQIREALRARENDAR
jgi:hypothetical protein